MQPSLVLLAWAVVDSILKSQEERMHETALKKVNSKHQWSRGHDTIVRQCHSTKNVIICFLSFLPQRVETEASEWGEGGPEKGKIQPHPLLKERQHSCWRRRRSVSMGFTTRHPPIWSLGRVNILS